MRAALSADVTIRVRPQALTVAGAYTAPVGKRPDDERLRLLLRVARRIEDEPAFGQPTSYTLHLDEHGLTHEVKEPPRPELRSLLMEVRKLDQPREDLYLPELLDIVSSRARDPDFLRGIADARRHYEEMQVAGLIQLSDNDGPITPRTAFELWAYGEHIHNDALKAERMDRLDENFRPLVRQVALDYMDMLALVARYLARVVREDPAFAAGSPRT